MCQCRFINGSNCTTGVGDVDNRGGSARVGTGSTQEISVPFLQHCYGPKSTLQHFYAFPKESGKASFISSPCFSEPCNWDGCTGLLQHTEVWNEPQTTLSGPMNTASLGSTTKWFEPQGISALCSKLPWLPVFLQVQSQLSQNCPFLLTPISFTSLHLFPIIAGISELTAPPSFLLLEQPC